MADEDVANPRISFHWRYAGSTADLAELSSLDEQTIIDELKARYQANNIYVSGFPQGKLQLAEKKH